MPARIIAKQNPFKPEFAECEVDAGTTIAELLPFSGDDIHVVIDGELITRDQWDAPLLGHELIFVTRMPQGKALGSILGTVIILAATVWAGPALAAAFGVTSAFGSAAITAGTSIMASLLVGSMIRPHMPSPGDQQSSTVLQSITGSRNRVNQFGVIPRVYGEATFAPPYAAMPYTEIVGRDQYVRLLFCLGYGPLSINGNIVSSSATLTGSTPLAPGYLKIGETDVSAFEDVQWEIGTAANLTLYTRDVYEETVGVPFNVTIDVGTISGEPNSAIRATQPGTQQIGVDFVWPAGLFGVNNKGKQRVIKTTIKIEYRLVGGSTWIVAETFQHADSTRTTRRYSKTWQVALGQYEVRITRSGTDRSDVASTLVSDFTWVALRSWQAQTVWNGNHILLALRIRASEQLNNQIDELFVKAKSVLPIWTGSAWIEAATANPAWAYLDAFTGQQVARPIPDSKIDIGAIKQWADWCDTNGIQYTWVHDGDETIAARMDSIASTGQGSRAIQDGIFTIVRDIANTPKQVITNRNSWGFRAERVFQDLPHALRVKYIDPTAWADTEVIIYLPGYSAANASKYEDFNTQGIASRAQAVFHGTYYYRQILMRPERYFINMDFENLAVVRGDMISIANDVIKVGLGAGRVKALTVDGGGAATSITLDDHVIYDPLKSYGVRIRKNTGAHAVVAVTGGSGEIDTLTLSAATAGVSVGDLVLFGEIGVDSIPAKVVGITPSADLSAALTLVPAATDIYDFTADPGFDPGITNPTPIDRIRPPLPIIVSVRAGLIDLPTDNELAAVPVIQIDYIFIGQVGLPALQMQARYLVLAAGLLTIDGNGGTDVIDTISGPVTIDARGVNTTGEYVYTPLSGPSGMLTITGVSPSLIYGVQIRSVNGQLSSPWSDVLDIFVTDEVNPDSLSVQGQTNINQLGLVINGGFESGDTSWAPEPGWTIVKNPIHAYQGEYFAAFVGPGTAALRNDIGRFACAAGERIQLVGWVLGGGGADGFACWRISWRNLSGAEFATDNTPAVVGDNTWKQVQIIATAPAGTAYAQIEAAVLSMTNGGAWWVDEASATRMPRNIDIDALQTTNGPAQAGADRTIDHLAAGIVGQGALATLNTIGGSQIDNNSVGTEKIPDNAVTSHVISENNASRPVTTFVNSGTGIPAYDRFRAQLVHVISGVSFAGPGDKLSLQVTFRVNVSSWFLKTGLKYRDSAGTIQTLPNTADALYIEIAVFDSAGVATSIYQELWQQGVDMPGMDVGVNSVPSIVRDYDFTATPKSDGSVNIPVITDFATGFAAGPRDIAVYMMPVDMHRQYDFVQNFNAGSPPTFQNTLSFNPLAVTVTRTTGVATIFKK